MISLLMIAKLTCAFGLVAFGVALGGMAGALAKIHDETTSEIDSEVTAMFGPFDDPSKAEESP